MLEKTNKYRPDIDGLRAVAVLAVIAFHAFPQSFKGGFIGVDIFFVISGFLITSIILDNIEQFSLREFYSRRIRRIFPALLLVLIACSGIGMFVLTTNEFSQLGKHIFGAATFISNFILWSESGYFDEAAETKPLLHLWSLGIEEQFYVVWPLLIWAAYLLRLNFLVVISALGTISFVLNILIVQQNNVVAFYSPLTRAWELSMGGMLAYLTSNSPKHLLKAHFFSYFDKFPEDSISRLKDGLSLVGGTLVALGFVFTTNGRAYPGLQALLPTIGTALLIFSGTHAVLNRLVLTHRKLVWIGLISYPLYLWHWPLLAFARIVVGGTPSLDVRLIAVGISFALAALTYWLLERPVRFGVHNSAKTWMLVGSMLAVGLTGFGFKDRLLPHSDAFAKVINDGDIGHDQFHKYLEDHFSLCMPMHLRKEAPVWKRTVRCFQSRPNDPIQIALIGDSHAEHLFVGLAESLPKKNVVYYIKNAKLDFDGPYFRNIFQFAISNEGINSIIITGAYSRWVNDINYTSFTNDIGTIISGLVAAKKTVYFVEDVPNFSFDVARCKYQRIVYPDIVCAESRAVSLGGREGLLSALSSIQRNNNVRLLKTSTFLCDNANCHMAKDGTILFRDRHHLNIPGSRFIGRKIIEANPALAD